MRESFEWVRVVIFRYHAFTNVPNSFLIDTFVHSFPDRYVDKHSCGTRCSESRRDATGNQPGVL